MKKRKTPYRPDKNKYRENLTKIVEWYDKPSTALIWADTRDTILSEMPTVTTHPNSSGNKEFMRALLSILAPMVEDIKQRRLEQGD